MIFHFNVNVLCCFFFFLINYEVISCVFKLHLSVIIQVIQGHLSQVNALNIIAEPKYAVDLCISVYLYTLCGL